MHCHIHSIHPVYSIHSVTHSIHPVQAESIHPSQHNSVRYQKHPVVRRTQAPSSSDQFFLVEHHLPYHTFWSGIRLNTFSCWLHWRWIHFTIINQVGEKVAFLHANSRGAKYWFCGLGLSFNPIYLIFHYSLFWLVNTVRARNVDQSVRNIFE